MELMKTTLIRRFLHRFADCNKLSYFMNIAFGLSLLMITLQFQFGNTVITVDDPPAIIELEQGYITEGSQVVRIVEGLIALGLITLGIERLRNGRRLQRSD